MQTDRVSLRKRQWHQCPCGAMVYRRRQRNMIVVYCYDCIAQRLESAALEMRDKRGPAWDAWLASNATGAPGRTATPERE